MAYDPDLICITESWLKPKFTNSEVTPKGFKVIARTDREGPGRGGGVIMFLKQNIPFSKSKSLHLSNETQICSATIKNHEIYVVYANPQRGREDDVKICELLEDPQNENAVFVGDFNTSDIKAQDWQNLEPNESISTRAKHVSIKSLYLMSTKTGEQRQHVGKSTHISKNILDLVFCRNELINGEPVVDEKFRELENFGLRNLDHFLVAASLNLSLKEQKKVKVIDDYEKADLQGFRDELKRIDFNRVINWNLDVNYVNTVFDILLIQTFRKYVPQKKVVSGCEKWTNPSIRNSVNRIRRFVKNKQFVKADNERKIKDVKIKECQENGELKILKNCESDFTQFYKYIRHLKGARTDYGTIRDLDGNECITDYEKAQAFNKALVTVYGPRKEFLQSWYDECDEPLEDIEFESSEVYKALTKFRNNTTPGIDNITAVMLKNAAVVITDVFIRLFRKVLDDGEIPRIWLKGVVIPIPKKEKPTEDPLSFRPITTQCLKLKAMETLILKAMNGQIKKKNYLCARQHGFEEGCSTITNLFPYWHDSAENIEKGGGMTGVNLDIKKGYDTVPNHHMLNKLHDLGLRGKIGVFVENWLTKREQVVKIGDEYSEPLECTSGNPQGGVLSSKNFCIFINSLVQELGDCSSFFADDGKIFMDVRNEEDARKLQEKLDIISVWAFVHGMSFSVKKCTVIRIGSNQYVCDYYLCGEKIQIQEKVPDLGITVSKNGHFNDHFVEKYTKTRNAIYQFRRNFSNNNEKLNELYYKTIAMPQLMYCSNIWMQGEPKILNLMKDFHEKFWKKNKIPERILTPEQFARKSDLALMHRIINKKTRIPFEKYFKWQPQNSRRSGIIPKLVERKCNKNIWLDQFSNRIASDFNRLNVDAGALSYLDFKEAAHAFVKERARCWRPSLLSTTKKLRFTHRKKKKPVF